MTHEFLPFSKPSVSDEAIDELVACVRSGWLTTGPRVERLEKAIREYLAAPRAQLLSSGTAGLHLALLALDLSPGDEVITTPLTFAATANTIVFAGARPVFVDIDPGTLNLDVARVAEAIGERTRVILPVHFAGRPADLEPLYDLATKHGLRVMEDAAHAVGAEYGGRRIGSFGDIQMFSFHPNKNMTTGEGGCLTTGDEALADRVARLSFHGIDREQLGAAALAAGSPYDVAEPGFKYNMMDLQAAIGLSQLESLDAFIARRTALAERYFELLEGWPQWRLPDRSPEKDRHAWHLFNPVLERGVAGMGRAEFIAAMAERGVGIGIHYPALHLFRYYREQFGTGPGDCPVAEAVGEGIVSLPLFPSMRDDDPERVVAAMREVFA